MPASFSTRKVAKGDGNASAKFNNLVQDVQNALNALGDTTKTAFTTATYIDPAKIQQTGAASGDWLAWSGTAWDNATPAATTATVLSDVALTSATSSIDFTSISGSYKHLYVIAALRTDRANTDDDLGIRLNNDSGSNYDGYSLQLHDPTPVTVSAPEFLANSSVKWFNCLNGDQALSGAFGTVVLHIPHYAGSTNNKIVSGLCERERSTVSGNVLVYSAVGAWRSNAAITRLTLLPLSGTNFLSGSRAVLYGY